MGGMHVPDHQCWNFPPISVSDGKQLNAPVTVPEIKKALFQIGPDKAPGPDGFSLGFSNNFGK